MLMPKPKLYFQSDIPATVTEIVRAMCADYPRRSRAIQFEDIPNAVRIRYIELNSIIDTALESVEIGIRKDLLRDVQRRRGYDFSPAAECISKNTYYRRKKKLIYDIAIGLHLI